MRTLTILLTLSLAGVAPVGLAAPELCDQTPDPARWEDVGTPDPPREHLRIMVHRGAANLAPENTIPAFEYAIAYGMDLIEIDVQQTADGRYVLFHDLEVDGKTDGSGYIFTMTYDEARALNAADNDKWRGSEYDPTPVAALEDALAIASEHGVGLAFDLKESVWNAAGVALLASQYPGVIERSIFQPYVPGRTEQILAVASDATIMFNNQFEDTPPAVLYALGQEYDAFGSSMPNYPPEAVAAIHDACDIVLPNVYQGDVTGSEAGDLAYARSIGTDGAMVNNPEVAADVLDRPVATRIDIDAEAGTACLLGVEDFGLPGKVLEQGDVTDTTRRGGCVPWLGGTVTFAGDGSALPSAA